jgi:glycosyltransferase involved in cell wall biosynthesis
MRILIATVHVPFVFGGAELHAEQLREALIRAGHETEIVAVPFKWYPAERILDHMLACRLLDLSEFCGVAIDRVIGLKFPAYLIPHRSKVLWILHQYRQAYDLWDHPTLSELKYYPHGASIRSAIIEADRQLLPEARAIFANSRNVASRLRRFCAVEAHPLYHPPPNANAFHCSDAEPFLFFPSRVTPIKRQSLVVSALALTRSPVRVRFAGAADNPADMTAVKRQAEKEGVSNRIDWLERVTEEEKIRLYSRAIAILYPVWDEDYGYVTLEAMLSSKPVITCVDSGGPREFVQAGSTGWVVDSTPEALAGAMDEAWQERATAARMGRTAREQYASLGISWEHVTSSLLA